MDYIGDVWKGERSLGGSGRREGEKRTVKRREVHVRQGGQSICIRCKLMKTGGRASDCRDDDNDRDGGLKGGPEVGGRRGVGEVVRASTRDM